MLVQMYTKIFYHQIFFTFAVLAKIILGRKIFKKHTIFN